MKIDDIKALLKAEPFRAFSIHYRTGQLFHVPERDRAWVPPAPTNTAIFVSDGRESFDVLDASWIVEVSFTKPAKGRRKAG